MYFLRCIIYMAALGILCFPAGRLLAKISFRADEKPLSPFEFEKNGKFYETLKIKSWQNKIPDVSRMFSKIVPRKSLETAPITAERLGVMINETCVAEITHVILSILGIALIFLWPGVWGIILFLVYVLLGNLPFIMIQRYNRPRLCKLRRALEAKEKRSAKPRETQQPDTGTANSSNSTSNGEA